jgi:predicted acetyltransferase
MDIRPITPEEKIMKTKIQAIAFLVSEDFSKASENPEEFREGYETCRAAFDDSGKMCSCLELIPFEVRFDGNTVPMGGIGGVASLPEDRNKRYIRNIFELSMKEMYEKGYVFSYLYPFSHQYYRKFGYELNMTLIKYSINISAFRHFEQTGDLKLYTDDMDPAYIIGLYDVFIKDKNLAVIRTEKLWKQFFKKSPYKDNVYLYIWYEKSGKAGGYVKFHVEKNSNGKNNMNVDEFVWQDRAAFTGILGFIGNLSAQIEKMIWSAPSFVNLLPLFSEPYEVKQEILTYGMNRVVNVEKAIEMMSSPLGCGEVTISVKDEFFPLNTGNYTIAWDDHANSEKNIHAEKSIDADKSTHIVTRSKKAPDMVCDVQALSQLITGFVAIDELGFAGKIDISGNKSALRQVFPKKKLFINDYF